MSHIIGIVGSRKYPHLDRVRSYVATLPPDTTIVSGGAQGVDTEAKEEGERLGLNVVVHKVEKEDWKRYGDSAGPRRNAKIVHDVDMIVAFWDGVSTGTLDCIRKAVKSNKKVIIYGVQERMANE